MDAYQQHRQRMADEQLVRRGIHDPRVLDAMARVPREQFMDATDPDAVYGDHALEIACEQTISQPYMVALMTEALDLQGHERVLEIGTGSGYQTAVLALLAAEVFTIERHRPLLDLARQRLEELGLTNISYRCGDGTHGWPAVAPFDRILVTAGGEHCPPALLEQLAADGELVGPFGGEATQTLQQIIRRDGHLETIELTGCRFVPLVSEETMDHEAHPEEIPPA